jgi:hypothetical protein
MCDVFSGTFTVRVLLFITRLPRRYGLSPEQVHVSPQLSPVSLQLFEVSPRIPSLPPRTHIFKHHPHMKRPSKNKKISKITKKDSKVQHTYPFESPIPLLIPQFHQNTSNLIIIHQQFRVLLINFR